MGSEYFSFIDFEDPLYFLVQKYRSKGSTSHYLSEMILMFLESVEHREWE